MKFIDNINIDTYNDFVEKNKNCNLFQSPQWVEVKNDWNYKRVAVVDNNKVIATAQILIRKGLWYLPRGPILDYENIDLLNYFLENLKLYAKTNNAKLLKIDIPEPLRKEKLENFKITDEDSKKDFIMNTFKNLKFHHRGFSLEMSDTIQPRFEAVSKLGDSYLENLPKHTKRLLKDVEKRFVEVRKVGVEQLDDFMFALSCTEKRKNITLRKKEYFENLFRLYKDDCLLFTAYLNVEDALNSCKKIEQDILLEMSTLTEKMNKKRKTLEDRLVGTRNLIDLFSSIYNEDKKSEQVLCSAISVKYGINSEMLYAGMNDKFSKIPAQYKVYVDTMIRFSEMGAFETSMGGVEGSLDDGLLKFKLHFNPHIVEHYGEFDYTFSYIFKFMYEYGLPLRKKFLKLLNSK